MRSGCRPSAEGGFGRNSPFATPDKSSNIPCPANVRFRPEADIHPDLNIPSDLPLPCMSGVGQKWALVLKRN